ATGSPVYSQIRCQSARTSIRASAARTRPVVSGALSGRSRAASRTASATTESSVTESGDRGGAAAPLGPGGGGYPGASAGGAGDGRNARTSQAASPNGISTGSHGGTTRTNGVSSLPGSSRIAAASSASPAIGAVAAATSASTTANRRAPGWGAPTHRWCSTRYNAGPRAAPTTA